MCVFSKIFVGHIKKKSKKRLIETYTFSFGVVIIFFTKIFQRNNYSIFVYY